MFIRGRGGLSLKTPRTYCASNWEDLDAVIKHIKSIYPEAPILALGFSYGGMILGNYLAEQGKLAIGYLNAAMLVSTPFDPYPGKRGITILNFVGHLNRY